MKKFVRGKIGRALSMALMILLLVPSLLLPLASVGLAASSGRQDIIILPFNTAAGKAPFNLGGRIIRAVQFALVKQVGVQVSELTRTSPILTSAIGQIDNSADREQLLADYLVAADSSADPAERERAAASLIQPLGVDAVVYGVVDEYEFTTNPNKTLIHVTAWKVTIGKDGAPYKEPIVVRGKSRVTPNGQGLQTTLDEEAISNLAAELGGKLTGNTNDIVKSDPPKVPTATPGNGTNSDDPGIEDVGPTPKKPSWSRVALLGLGAVALALALSGGGGGTAPPPVQGEGTAIGTPTGIRIMLPLPAKAVKEYRIYREGPFEPSVRASRARVTGNPVATLTPAQVTSDGQYVILMDGANSTPPLVIGKLYTYQVVVAHIDNSLSENLVYNADSPAGLSRSNLVGAGIPAPVSTLTAQSLGGSIVGLAWTISDPNTLIHSFVIQHRVAGSSGAWTNDATLTDTSVRSATVIVSTPGVYEYRVIPIGLNNSWVYPGSVLVKSVTVTLDSLPAPTELLVTPHATNGGRQVALVLSWREPIDPLVQGYQVYRQVSTRARNSRFADSPSLLSGKLTPGGRGDRSRGRASTIRPTSSRDAGTWEPIGSFIPKGTPGGVKSIEDPYVQDNHWYSYRVMSKGESLDSVMSQPSNEVLVDIAPGNVRSLTGTAGDNQATLSWLAPNANADGSPISLMDSGGFRIFRKTTAPASSTGYLYAELASLQPWRTVNWSAASPQYQTTDTTASNRATYYYVCVPFDNQGQSSIEPYPFVMLTPQPTPQVLTMTAATHTLTAGAPAQALSLTVKDAQGVGIKDVAVTVSCEAGKGTVAPTRVVTNASGIATAQYTPPATVAADVNVLITAQVENMSSVSATWNYLVAKPIPTTIQVLPAKSQLKVIPQGAQQSPPSESVTTVTVKVTDANNVGMAGQAVMLNSSDMELAFIDPAQPTVYVPFLERSPAGTTNALGEFSVQIRAGTVARDVTLTAVTGTTFGTAVVQVQAGEPVTLQVTVPDEVSGSAAGSVSILDGNGNPVPNILVTLSVNHGSVQPAIVTTGTDGQAPFSLQAGTYSGPAVITAATQGITPVSRSIIFEEQKNPELIAGSIFYTVGQTQSMTWLLKDASWQPLANTSVKVTVLAGQLSNGAQSGSTITLTTGVDGQITFSFTAPIVLGPTMMRFNNATTNAQIGSDVTLNVVLPAPSGLIATTASSTSVNLAWTAVPNGIGYTVECSPDQENWAAIATVGPATKVTYLHTGLIPGARYFYRVRANHAQGYNSDWSNTAEVVTSLAAPPALVAVPGNDSSIVLTWDDINGETGYKIQRSPNGTTGWADLTTTAQDVVTFTDVNLTPDTTYYYRVAATNPGGDSPWSNVASATTRRIQIAQTFRLQVKSGEATRIYYSRDPDDHLTAASRQSTILELTGYTAQGIGAAGTRVKLVTTKGTFEKLLTDQTVSPDGKQIIGTLGAGGQMVVQFQGRVDDGATTSAITLPSLDELGVPQFSAMSFDPIGDSIILSGTMLGPLPALVGPPHNIVFKPLVPPAPPLNEPQLDKWPVLFQEQTMTVGAVATDLAGQAVLADMPIWFTQSWQKLTDVNAEPSTDYYNRTLGHANITGSVSMTNDAGEASAGFASNYSGLYTIYAFALRRVYERALLEGINLTDDGGLPTAPIPADVAANLLPASNGATPNTLVTTVTDNTNVLNKTFAYYDHWTILTISHQRINCDGTMTSRITFGATDEHFKKVLPSVPFNVTTSLGVLQLDNGTFGTTVKNKFNERSESYILSRGTVEHPTIGFVSLTFNNLRSVQPMFMMPNLITHYGPSLTEALDVPPFGWGVYLNPSEPGMLHRIAGATDNVQDPTKKAATISVYLRDVDGNAFPFGYTILITGTVTPYFSTGVLGSSGTMGRWETTYSGPNLNDYGVDELSEELTVTISGPTVDGDFDSRSDWTDRTIITERPSTGTISPKNLSETGLRFIRFGESTLISVATRDVSSRRNLPTYPIRFDLVKIYRADGATLSATTANLDGTSVASVTLSPGNVYGKIRIYAYYDKNNNGSRDADEVLDDTGILTIGLPTPTNLNANAISSSEITLTWLNVADEAGYKIERSPNGTSNWNHIATVGADVTTYTDAGLTFSTQFYYRVVSLNYAGDEVLSQYSDVATNTTFPLAPDSLSAVALSPTQIRLNWTNVLRENGFVIQRSTDLVNWTASGTTAADVLTLTVDTLNPGTLYHFRVLSTNAQGGGAIGGNSVPSPVVSVSTLPAVPVNLKAVGLSDSSIRLTWNDVFGETGYDVEFSTNNTLWSPLATLPAGTTSYDVTGLADNTLYYFRIGAINASGVSWTASVSLTTIPISPAPATAVAVAKDQINVFWEIVTGATAYKVWRSPNGINGWIDLTTTALGPTITTLADKQLTAGTLYYYRVIAVNAAGGQSAPATAFTATFPENPLEPVVLPISSTQIDLSWGPVAGSTGYRVQRSLNGTTGWVQVGLDLGATTFNYSDTGLTQSTRYHYRVIAISAGGPSAPGAVKDGLTYPATPANLAAMVTSDTRIDLSWDAVSRATGYQVERSLTGTGGWVMLTATPITVTNYADTTVVGGTQYYYRVTALNATGGSLPAITNTMTLPAMPTNVSATAVSATQVDLTWSMVTGATSYTVERRITGTLAWVTVTTTLTTNSFSDTTCSAGTRYDYRIIAATATGNSQPSNPIIGVLTMPEAPTNLIAVAANANQIDLAWDGVTGVTGYRVQRSLNGTTGWVDLAPDPTATQFSDTAVQAGTRYYYRILALNASGASQPGNVANALTQAGMPSNLVATAISTTQINLAWTAGMNAVGYRIERSLDGTTWVEIGTSTATAYSDTTCAIGTRYYYRVFATNDSGDSAASPVVNTITYPAPVIDLTATAVSDALISLAWTATTGASSYRIDRSLNGTVWTNNYAVATTSSYDDTGCAAGTTYYYRVYSVNTSGESSISNIAEAMTYPASPTGLTAVAASTTTINLSWTSAAGSTGYRIERSLDAVAWSTVGTSAVTTYVDTTCAIGTLYYYRVFASTATRESASSNMASAITYPAPVIDLVATAVSDNQVSLSWTATTGASGYRIDRSLNGTIWTTNYATVTIPSYDDAGCGAGTTYYYRVYATNASGLSAVSNVAQALTNPGAPSAVTVIGYGATNVALSWGIGQGATGYRVERSPDGTLWNSVGTTSNLTFDDTTCAAGTNYHFRVISTNATGDSTPSNVVQQLTTPNKPENLTATALSSTRISLAWSDTMGETGYRIERSLDMVLGWQQIGGILPANTTTFIDDTCQALITYYYRIVAINASGDSPQSDVASATTSAVRSVVSMKPVSIVTGNPTQIYYSAVPDDQLVDRAPLFTDLLIEGVSDNNLPASWATVAIATNRGSFKVLSLDQSVSADKKTITVVLNGSGQAIIRFYGKTEDASPGLPSLMELGSPILTASSDNIPYSLTFANDGNTPKLIGPPNRIAFTKAIPTFPYQVPDTLQRIWEGMDVLYQTATMGITATVTDMAGSNVLPSTPIWFTQSWTRLTDVTQTADPAYYNKALGAGNIGGIYGMTNGSGQVTAQFASNYSGVYMIHAFALKKDFDRTKLDPIDNLTTADPADYQPYLHPADATGNPVTYNTAVVNKTYSFYDHWEILKVSRDRINCDGTMTSSITLQATDEQYKLVLPGVPFRISSYVQKGKNPHQARLERENNAVITAADYIYFNERSEASVLSRGNLTKAEQWIGPVTIQMDNMRPLQQYYRIPVMNPDTGQWLTHYGPALQDALVVTFPIFVAGVKRGVDLITGINDLTSGSPPKETTFTVKLRDITGNSYPGGYQVDISFAGSDPAHTSLTGEVDTDGNWVGTYSTNLGSAKDGYNEVVSISIEGENNTMPDVRSDWGMPEDFDFIVERPVTGSLVDAPDESAPLDYSITQKVSVESTNHNGDTVNAGFQINFEIVPVPGGGTPPTLNQPVRTTNPDGVAEVSFNTGNSYCRFKVRAYYDRNLSGTLSGGELLAETGVIQVGMAPPTNFQATKASSSQIDLSWTSSLFASRYEVQVSPDGATWSDLNMNVSGAATSFVHTNVPPSTIRYYRMRSVYVQGQMEITSNWTPTRNATTDPAPPPPPLPQPTGVIAQALTPTTVEIIWTAVTGATKYTVERKLPQGLIWTELSANVATNAYSDTTCAPGTTYTYRITATNATNTSIPSAVVTVTTPP